MKYIPIITYMERNPFEPLEYSEVDYKCPNWDDDKGVWVVGDVHGCYKTLKLLLSHLPDDANICFTGDLVDRGPRSMQVLDLVMEKGYDCVLGNHDLMFLSLLLENNGGDKLVFAPQWYYPCFFRHGGMNTIKSFGLEAYEAASVPVKYMHFLAGLPIYIKYPLYDDKGQELLVSHSCLDKNWTLHDAANNIWSENGMLWTRGRNKSPTGYYHIFGHSPNSKEPTVKRNYACIDTGACFANAEGRLTAMHFPSKKIIQVNNIDMEVDDV